MWLEEGQVVECTYCGRAGWWSGTMRELGPNTGDGPPQVCRKKFHIWL
jgi:hypothetical protein